MTPEELNTTNYHSLDSNKSFMSVHSFKDWCQCPAKAFAKNNGAWDEGPQLAFEFGGYVDAYLTTPLEAEAWFSEHKESMVQTGMLSKAAKTYGAKLAHAKKADEMIEKAKSSKLFMDALTGESQKIITFELYGVQWRAMMDSTNMERSRITDLKTAKSITEITRFDRDDIFSKMNGTCGEQHFYGDYIDKWNYWTQTAVYKKGMSIVTNTDVRDWSFLIAAISKETPRGISPSLPAWRFVPLDMQNMQDDAAIERELAYIEEHIEQVIRWKHADDPTPMCKSKKCAFCLAHSDVTMTDKESVVRY